MIHNEFGTKCTFPPLFIHLFAENKYMIVMHCEIFSFTDRTFCLLHTIMTLNRPQLSALN